MKQPNISVVISAHNEENRIEKCLASVSWVDEIVLIDNESRDRTAEIAKKYNAKVFSAPNNLMLNKNKNYGFTKATGRWILNLDADEVVTPQLREEIKAIIANPEACEAYEMPRKNMIFGKWMQHAGWYPDYQIRLFRKGKGRFPEAHVHEKLWVSGSIGRLTHPLHHYNYDSVRQFMLKTITIYAPNEAENLLNKGYSFAYQDAIRFPLREFLGRFFAQEGYKDGFHGLILSILMAFYHFVVFLYLWEKHSFVDRVDMPSFISSEEQKIKKEYAFWRNKQKIDQAKNSIQKLFFSCWNKLQSI
jgi:glycosyltransferase involved in cell wall biosynthesis